MMSVLPQMYFLILINGNLRRLFFKAKRFLGRLLLNVFILLMHDSLPLSIFIKISSYESLS